MPEASVDGTKSEAPPDKPAGHSGRKPADHPMPTANPPPPPRQEERLPVWGEVESGHPDGATNPPRPVLVVLEDRSRCWKEWHGGMQPPTEEIMQIGGRIISDPTDANGTEIQCDMRRVQNMMDRKAAVDAGEK